MSFFAAPNAEDNQDRAMLAQWQHAAATAGVVTALEGIYADCARQIEARGPACWASGRCCNFDSAGHLLFVTGLEVAYCLARLPTAQVDPGHALSLPQASTSAAGSRCEFQAENLCTVHTIKPLGCRIYFCDKSAQVWQHEVHEQLLGQIRQLHTNFGLEYRYGEWRGMLRAARHFAQLQGPPAC